MHIIIGSIMKLITVAKALINSAYYLKVMSNDNLWSRSSTTIRQAWSVVSKLFDTYGIPERIDFEKKFIR